MARGTKEQERNLWNFIDRIEGDKVVLIILFLLTLISILAIFSSTSTLTGASRDRLDLLREHAKFIGIGYILIYVIYKIKSIKVIRVLSQIGFGVSFALLAILDFNINLGIIRPERVNEAGRTLNVLGLHLHVFEVTKVAMVMYLAWALHSYRQDSEAIAKGKKSPTFSILNRLSRNPSLSFLAMPQWKRIFYIYIPWIAATGMVLPGSNSSALLIGGICLLMVLIGRMPFKEIVIICCIGVIMLGACVGIYFASGKTVFKKMRFDELITRLTADYSIERLIEIENDPKLGPKCKEWYEVRDEIKQPYSARIAIHEGGLIGKLSGNSTQKYVTAHIYSDYMYSFLIEEYGLLGGILVLMLFVSLLARGSFIAKLCQHDFAKHAVGGLSLLISGQAFMHICVNTGLFPMTGQTLPMISDGSFAFLMFCIAFGIILCISKMAKKQIREQEEAFAAQYEKEKELDDVQSALNVVENIE
jgi:cell division protein FtsW